jgi:hypothetical protein
MTVRDQPGVEEGAFAAVAWHEAKSKKEHAAHAGIDRRLEAALKQRPPRAKRAGRLRNFNKQGQSSVRANLIDMSLSAFPTPM